MKLSDTAPEQHKAILVLAGVFIFINVLDVVKASWREEGADGKPIQRVTQIIDEQTGTVVVKDTKYQNPEMSWWDRLMCRGYQRSSKCNLKLLHPKTSDADDYGIEVPRGAPKNDHVVYFKGSLNKNTALSGNIASPEADDIPARVYESQGGTDPVAQAQYESSGSSTESYDEEEDE